MIEGQPAVPEESTDADVAVGAVLAGKYRVERILGKGGMGLVVAATHLDLDVLVAIKILLPEFRSNAEVVARFSREARAAAQIKSEFVTRTIDIGRLEDGTPYIVMEYLHGVDLAHRIHDGGPLPVASAVQLVLDACEALSEAHRMGIIHRDFKPSNLFLVARQDGTEVAKILDFGISKITTVGAVPHVSMTRTSSMMGSPLYMSPEQLIDARKVDPRSDIWAIGVTLFEALMGVPPFLGGSFPELCSCILTQPAPRLSYRPDVPLQLEAVVLRCLEKNPAARFESAAQLAQALRPFLHPSLLPPPSLPRDTGFVSSPPKPVAKRGVPWLAIAVVGVLVGALGVGWALAVRSSKNPAAASATLVASTPPAASQVDLPPTGAVADPRVVAEPDVAPASSPVATVVPPEAQKAPKPPVAGGARPTGGSPRKPAASTAASPDLFGERN